MWGSRPPHSWRLIPRPPFSTLPHPNRWACNNPTLMNNPKSTNQLTWVTHKSVSAWTAEGSTDAWNEKMEKGWHQRRWVQWSRAVFGFLLACDGVLRVVGSCCSLMASQISSLVSLSSGGMSMNMLCLGMRSRCPCVVRHARFRGSIRIGEKRREFFCDTPTRPHLGLVPLLNPLTYSSTDNKGDEPMPTFLREIEGHFVVIVNMVVDGKTTCYRCSVDSFFRTLSSEDHKSGRVAAGRRVMRTCSRK